MARNTNCSLKRMQPLLAGNSCGATGNLRPSQGSTCRVEHPYPFGCWERIWSCFATTGDDPDYWVFTVRTEGPT